MLLDNNLNTPIGVTGTSARGSEPTPDPDSLDAAAGSRRRVLQTGGRIQALDGQLYGVDGLPLTINVSSQSPDRLIGTDSAHDRSGTEVDRVRSSSSKYTFLSNALHNCRVSPSPVKLRRAFLKARKPCRASTGLALRRSPSWRGCGHSLSSQMTSSMLPGACGSWASTLSAFPSPSRYPSAEACMPGLFLRACQIRVAACMHILSGS